MVFKKSNGNCDVSKGIKMSRKAFKGASVEEVTAYDCGYKRGFDDASEQLLRVFDHYAKPGKAIFSQDLREKLFTPGMPGKGRL